jgi:hypothetical protein
LLIVIGLATIGYSTWQSAAPFPQDGDGLKALQKYIIDLANTVPIYYLLWPFRALLAPFFATNWFDFATALPAALALFALHYWWVISANVAFEEASIELSRKTAERIAARSTNSGTPVKSCSITLATTNGISSERSSPGFHAASARTFASLTFWPSSKFRNTDSRTILIEIGRRDIAPRPSSSSWGSEYNVPSAPVPVRKVCRVLKRLCVIVLKGWKSLNNQFKNWLNEGQAPRTKTVQASRRSFA